MQIKNNSLVTIHYILRDSENEIIESTYDSNPLEFIQGKKDIVYGLEKAMLNRVVGEKFLVTVDPEDAYGDYNHKLITNISKDNFDTSMGLEVGMVFQSSKDGVVGEYTVIEINDDSVVLDGNHPFAGETLYFEVEIISIN